MFNLLAVSLSLLLLVTGAYGTGRSDKHQDQIDTDATEQGEPFERVGNWRLASPTEVEPLMQQQSYETHVLTSPGADGLPTGCISYHDRYEKYINASSDMSTANLQFPDSRYAVLLRIHRGLKWTEDLKLSTRALISEANEEGWHVWLLAQETIGPKALRDWNPAHLLLSIPSEFRSLLHAFTAEQIHLLYPKAHNHRGEGYHEEDGAPLKREYLGPTAFLRHYPMYEFAFVMEYVVRVIGFWGEFFSRAFQISRETLAGNTRDESASQAEQDIMPIPDLILFTDDIHGPLNFNDDMNGVEKSPQWHFPRTETYKEFTAIYGLSQGMVEQIHKHSSHGSSGFIEEFIPTLAAHTEVDVVVMPLKGWNGASALHCCLAINTQIYDEWKLNDVCHDYTILHPVKNLNESIWGS